MKPKAGIVNDSENADPEIKGSETKGSFYF
jgi:hypothetical protein